MKMTNTPAANIESKEPPKCVLWFIGSILILFILTVFSLLVFDSYTFATIINGDPTFKYRLSLNPMDMETAIPAAKLYLGFTVTILSMFLFQLTTCVTAFKLDLNVCFVYPFLASVVINLIVFMVYYFMADWRVKLTPMVTFWTTLGMANGIAKIAK